MTAMSDNHLNAPASPIPGWTEFVEAMRDLPERVLARLPERVRNDPQTRLEAGRRIMASFAFSTLDAIAGDGDYPVFRAAVGQIMNIGQPNADTAYRIARITPGGTYRLRGTRGSMRIAIIAQRGPFPPEPGGEGTVLPGPSLAHHDLNAVQVDGDGRFDVLLSPTRPGGYTGEWWQLMPRTNKLWLRQVKGDWVHEEEPAIAVERLDIALGGRPRRSAAELEDCIRRLPGALYYYSTIEIEHVEKLRQNGFLNDRMTYYDTTNVVGLADQYYFECAYELADDEALIVEAKIPPVCGYWSVMLTNEIFETVDWYNNHSALNDTQASPDSDGVVRFVISAKDPGVPNWLDTAGYPSGQFQGRWYQSEGATLPEVRKVAFSDVRRDLPAETRSITPEERDRLIRERRMWLQLRRLW
jgi:hypothetical protein